MIHYLFTPILIFGVYAVCFLLNFLLVWMEDNNMKMKTIIACLVVLLVLVCLLTFTGCNTQIIDTHWHFSRAIIKLPDGEIVAGTVDSWRDFEDGDQLQVTIDGVTYLTHSTNVVLIDENDE